MNKVLMMFAVVICGVLSSSCVQNVTTDDSQHHPRAAGVREPVDLDAMIGKETLIWGTAVDLKHGAGVQVTELRTLDVHLSTSRWPEATVGRAVLIHGNLRAFDVPASPPENQSRGPMRVYSVDVIRWMD